MSAMEGEVAVVVLNEAAMPRKSRSTSIRFDDARALSIAFMPVPTKLMLQVQLRRDVTFSAACTAVTRR